MNAQHIQLNVPLSFKQVIDIVKQLSPIEKQQLSEVLWTEQSVGDMIIPEEHKQVVRQRIKKYENQPNSYLSWDDIERKMAARK
ncbi:MAG: addiction module protein [Salinivirgaceae bacterium]|nr:addiction module protein [Salinivirgaceae bacterium]